MRMSFLLFFLCSMFSNQPVSAAERVENGLLDLRGSPFDEPIELSGDWNFYWQVFIEPGQILGLETQGTLIKVPGLWTQTAEHYPAFGYGTYRLQVLLDEPRPLAFNFPATIYSSSRVFVDGFEVAKNGQLGTSANSSSGGQSTRIYAFTPKQSRFEVIIQVANFEIFLAGMTSAPSLGSLESITLMRFKKIALDTFLVGALFIMGIYHLCLFSLRRSDPSTFHFGLLCLAGACYLLVSRDGILTSLIPTLNFTTRLRFYNVSWILSIAVFTWFTSFIFRRYYSRWVPISVSVVSFGFIVHVLTSSHRIFVDSTSYFRYVTAAIMLYSFSVIVYSALKRLEGAAIFLSGVLFLMMGVLLDLLTIQGSLNLPPMSGSGLFCFIFFQSYLIARKFSFAFKRVRISEKAIRKLSDQLKTQHDKVLSLNSNLEQMVDQKTRDIRSIMEHIPLGIFMIKPDFHIHKDYSRHLKDMLQSTPETLEQNLAPDLIFQHSDLSSDQRSQAESAIQSSLGEHVVNFEMNAHNLPTDLIQTAQGRSRILDLTWNAIEDSEERVEKILVTLRDVTELRKLQERSKDQQEELEFIGEILNISAERFLRFIQSCRSFIEENSRLIHTQGIRLQNLEVLKVLFINMHTIKGAARSLYFKKMTQVFHDVEQYYASIQKDKPSVWDLSRMERDLDEARRIVSIYERIAEEKLGRSQIHTRQVEFPTKVIEGLYQEIRLGTEKRQHPPETLALFEHLQSVFHQKLFKPAESIFADIFECLSVLARDLQKELPLVHLNAPGLLMSEKEEELFRRIFVHLLRNSMDHGIESAEERARCGKPAQGQISIEVARQGDRLHLIYQDDGRGFDIQKISEIGLERGLLTPGVTHSPQVIVDLIFDSGLSTANQLTDISGRGVGMDAVRRFLQDAQGHIAIELGQQSKPGFYSAQFHIELPFEGFEQSLAA